MSKITTANTSTIKKISIKTISIIMSILMLVCISMSNVFLPNDAYASIPDKGRIKVTNVADGETFKAVRIIDSKVVGSSIDHSFVEGIVYDEGKQDKGVLDFFALRGTDLAEGTKTISGQITDNHDTYYSTTAANGTALFENLPLGIYLITPIKTNDDRIYSHMLGYMLPTFSSDENMWALEDPVSTVGKWNLNVKDPELNPSLKVSKTVNPTSFSDTNAVINYNIVISANDAEKVQFLHIEDMLSADAIKNQYSIHEDVAVKYINESTEISSAKISYKYVDDRVVGFSIDIPESNGSKNVVITYTGDASRLSDSCVLENTASAYAAGITEVDDHATTRYNKQNSNNNNNTNENNEQNGNITSPSNQNTNDNGGNGTSSDYVEQNKTPQTPQDIIQGIITQTGDAIWWIVGGLVIVIGAGVVIFIKVRRRNKE